MSMNSPCSALCSTPLLGPSWSTPTLLLYKMEEIPVPARIYWPVYSFPVAAVTKYHKSSDFNRNVSSQGPGDQKSKMSPTGLTSRCQQEEFSWEAPGEIYSMSSPVSGGFWHSLACGCISLISASFCTSSSLLIPSLTSPLALALSVKIPSAYILYVHVAAFRAYLIIQDYKLLWRFST